MLDEIGQRIDHAGDDDLIIVERQILQTAVLVRVARIGERQHEAAHLGLTDGRQHLGQGHVAVVRAFVVAPAGVQPHHLARHVDERVVDRRHHAFHEADELAQRAVLIGDVPLHREVRRVDLQHEAVSDDGLVFHLQCAAECREIGVLGVVPRIAHRRGDDAG